MGSGVEKRMPWDLDPLQLNWFGMAIGAGFSITTPLFRLRYADPEVYRCFSLVIHFMGFQLCITIPLWIEYSGMR
jgi:hypothetical protein